MSRPRSTRWRASAIAALWILTGWVGCTSDEEKLATQLARGEEDLADGRPEEALIEFRNALRLDPQSAETNYRIARVLHEQGMLADALFYYTETTRLDPTRSDAALFEAKLLLFEDPDRSQELIEAVLKREPANATAHVRRSELALARADSRGALEAALAAIEYAPDDAFAQMQLGIVRRAQIRERRLLGEPDDESLHRDAIAPFEAAIALSGDRDRSLLMRARLEQALVLSTWESRVSEAPAAFRTAVQVALPGEEQQVLDEALRFARTRGDAELEGWVLQRSVEISPDSAKAWRDLAHFEAREGRSHLAVLERFVEERPANPWAHATYARSLNEERHEEAMAHLESVASETSDPAVVWATLAELHIAAGELDAADEVVSRLTSEYPDHPQTTLAKAALDISKGRSVDAAATLRRLVKTAETPWAYLLLATSERHLGNIAAAAAAIERAIEISPPPVSVALLRRRGTIQVANQDWAGVVRTYRTVLLRQGGRLAVEDVLRLARALHETGRPDAARRQLDLVIEAPDTPLEAFLLYASIEYPVNRQRALELLQQADQRFPANPRVLRELVLDDLRNERPEAALARLEAALAQRPDAGNLWLLRARVLAAMGQLEAASESTAKVLELNPGSPSGIALHLRLLRSLGREEEVLASLEAAQRSGDLVLPQRVMLARLLTERGEDARAMKLLESVLEGQPNGDPTVMNDLAFLLARQNNDLDRALSLALRARSASPEHAEIADTLGYVHLRRDEPQAAVDQFRAALELSPSRDELWATYQFHLGLGLKALGRREDAVQAFEKALASASDFPEATSARRELEALRGGAASEDVSS